MARRMGRQTELTKITCWCIGVIALRWQAQQIPAGHDGLDSPRLGVEAHPGVRSNGDVMVNAT
jgi:hypothetical protein